MQAKYILFAVLFFCFSLCSAQQVVSTGGFEVHDEISINWILGGSLSGLQGSDTKIADNQNKAEEPEMEIKIYPLPVTDFLNIEFPVSVSGRVFLEIYDAHGIKTISSNCDFKPVIRLDLKNIPAGTYLLKIITSGRYPLIRKIIKN